GQCGDRNLPVAGAGADGGDHGAARGGKPERRHDAGLQPYGGRGGRGAIRGCRRQAVARRAIARIAGAAGAGGGDPVRAVAGSDARRYVQHGGQHGRGAMIWRRLLTGLALLGGVATPALGDRLLSAMSNDQVEITSSFDGEKMTFFGSIVPDV